MNIINNIEYCVYYKIELCKLHGYYMYGFIVITF